VGKTLTAETVALATRKPLLPISVAEISIEPNKAEKNLVEIFADAGRWEAVSDLTRLERLWSSTLDPFLHWIWSY